MDSIITWVDFFGSRIVQTETNDRIYDDNNKIWYIYIHNETPVAFVSLLNNTIKNVYSITPEYLGKLLLEIKSEIDISCSIVTKIYKDTYIACGFNVIDSDNYKNFVTIRSEANEKNRISSLIS